MNDLVLGSVITRFVEEYIVTGNAREAAIAAGYSSRNALGVANRLLARPDVKDKLNQYWEAQAATPGEVKARLTKIARSSMADVYTFDPFTQTLILDFERAAREGNLDVIKSVRTTSDGGVEVVLYDRLKALEVLAKGDSVGSQVNVMVANGTQVTFEEVLADLEQVDAAYAALEEVSLD